MTEWTTHIPKFDGDAPEGVSIGTHIVEWSYLRGDHFRHPEPQKYTPWRPAPEPLLWEVGVKFRYRLDTPIVAKSHEAWRPVLEAYLGHKMIGKPKDCPDMVEGLKRALRVAMTIPACMDDIRE